MQKPSRVLRLLTLMQVLIGPSLAAMPEFPAPDFASTELRAKVTRYKVDLVGYAFQSGLYYYLQANENLDWQPAVRTVGNGTTYTLQTLAGVTGTALETTTTGYVLRDRIIIAPGDALVCTDGQLIFADRVTTPEADHWPGLIIQGRLLADHFAFLSTNPDDWQSTTSLRGKGLIVVGDCTRQQGIATLTHCQIRGLHSGLLAHDGAKVELENTTISACATGTAATSGSEITVRNCHLLGGDPFSWGTGVSGWHSLLVVLDSTFARSGIISFATLPGSHVTRCTMDGSLNGKTATLGISTSQDRLSVRETTIRGYHMGVLCSDSSATLEHNVIENCTGEGLVAAFGGAPRVRRTIVRGNCSNPEGILGTTGTLAAVVVLDAAQLDLGTQADPGRNQFIGNDALCLYHAGFSTNTVQAVGNDWQRENSPTGIDALIYHQPDDAQDPDTSDFLSGWVNYLPSNLNKARHWQWFD